MSRLREVGPTFRGFLSAYAIQTTGEGVVIAALPLLVASLTSDPRLVALVSLCLELPWLILALPLGVIIDSTNRRRLIIGAQVVQAVVAAVVALTVLAGHGRLEIVLLLALVLGTGDILFMGASKAIIPRIVPTAALESANGLNVTVETIGRNFAGPALGALLFAVAHSLPLWIVAITYAVSIAIVLRIRDRPEFEARTREERADVTLLADVREGAVWLLRHPVLRVVAGLAAVSNFSVLMGQSTLVLFAREELGISASGYGLLVASMAVGGVLGGLGSSRIARRHGPRLLIPLVAAASAVSLVAIGVLGRAPWVVAVLFCVWSFGLSVWNVVAQSLSQRLIPSELMGRVGGASRMLAFGALPLGALAGGLVAEAGGLRSAWIVGGLLHLVVTIAALPLVLRWRPEDLQPVVAVVDPTDGASPEPVPVGGGVRPTDPSTTHVQGDPS